MTALGGRRNIAARVLIVAGLAMAMLGAAGLVARVANLDEDPDGSLLSQGSQAG